MAKRLTACGIRPINNIVDVTNYILLKWGHPLHAFDLAKLKGHEIVIRRAKEGEKIEALDGKSYTLKNEDLVIADAENPVAIAGIMGGQGSGVTDSTTDILLESAVFNSSNIRSTSRRLGLKSESSLRFEKGTSPETAQAASARAAQLILEVAGGRPGRAQDSYPKKSLSTTVEFQIPRVKRLIGTDIKDSNVERILTGLEYKISKDKTKWKLTAPFYRRDVTEEADVVERASIFRLQQNSGCA
jgi:phenylalanyl-tRNA synthetase beta chain